MNALGPIDDIVWKLRAVSAAEGLPESVRTRANRLIEQLTAPVRVALVGLPCRERMELFHALAGEAAPEEHDFSIPVELHFAPQETCEITLLDGSVRAIEGRFSPEKYMDAVFVSFGHPAPILERISFLDVAADAAPHQQRAAISWAMSRTDIALWVSPKFTESELRIWETVPDQMMDHAYLVLTGSADGPDRVALQDRALAMAKHFKSEFLDVLPIGFDTDHGKQVLSNEGIEALIDRILRHSDAGRRADADGALFFLKSVDPTHVRTAAPAPASAPAAAVSEPAEPDEIVTLYARAFTYLRDRGGALLTDVRAGDAPDAALVLAHCGETLTTLSDMLADADHEPTPGLTALANTLSEAEELLILLELEPGTAPAVDAASLLLQLRRDFEARLAA
ncbi:MAG: hypothetical protein AAGJ74_02215 [Pseudomonadota bacterium]